MPFVVTRDKTGVIKFSQHFPNLLIPDILEQYTGIEATRGDTDNAIRKGTVFRSKEDNSTLVGIVPDAGFRVFAEVVEYHIQLGRETKAIRLFS